MGRTLAVSAMLALGATPTSAADPSPGAGGPAVRRAAMLGLKPLDRGTVRRAVDLALAALTFEDCQRVYSDFQLPEGDTPQGRLDGLGMGPGDFLETLVFADGNPKRECRTGAAVLVTTPGTGLIFVCPGFAEFQLRNARASASLVIHESLHALGLGENPPTSQAITRRVERRCWRLPVAMPPRLTRAVDSGARASAVTHDPRMQGGRR